MSTRREFLGLGAVAAIASWGEGAIGRVLSCGEGRAPEEESRRPKNGDKAVEVPKSLDHLLLGCGDLASGIAYVEERTGIKAAFFGVLPGRGTQSAILSLGELRYLEINAPDPQQSAADEHASRLRRFLEPRLLGWAVDSDNLKDLATRLAKAGVVTRGPYPGSRKWPDGREINWMTLTQKDDDDNGLLPFFIEWGVGSVHPSLDAPKGCALKRFWLESPKAEELVKRFAVVGVEVEVKQGEKARLRARIVGPKGEVEF